MARRRKSVRGAFGEVCDLPMAKYALPQLPMEVAPWLTKAYGRQARRENVIGKWGNKTYERELVPGVFATTDIRVSPQYDAKHASCIEEKGTRASEYTGPRPWPYATAEQPIFDWVDMFVELQDRTDDALGRNQELYETFYLAFEGVLPPTILENAIVYKDRDLKVRKPGYTNTELNMHRDDLQRIGDNLDQEFGEGKYVAVGQMLLFRGINPAYPAEGPSTVWFLDTLGDQVVHSRPLADSPYVSNFRLTRYFVVAPRADVERTFPGTMVPETFSAAEFFDPGPAGVMESPSYVGGGGQFSLGPGEVVVHAANILPPLIDTKWVRENYERIRRQEFKRGKTPAIDLPIQGIGQTLKRVPGERS